MNFWLMQPDALREVEALHKQLSAQDLVAARAAFDAHMVATAAADGMPRCLQIRDSEAEITISGPLSNAPQMLFYLFDRAYTTYGDITAALAVANASPAIKRITLKIDSPGGTVAGLFDTIAALQATTKRIDAKVVNAHSAAYAIAAQAHRIEATGPASMFGSIGVATTFFFWLQEEIVDITNTESPNKRPNVRTEDGKAVVRAELDALHELFVDAIATGRARAKRTISAKELTEKFGAGASFVAAEAKRREMIDALAKRVQVVGVGAGAQKDDDEAPEPSEEREQQTAAGGQENDTMDLKKLKAEHPELYAAILAEGEKIGEAKGHETGAKAERDRINAHLTMGQSSGDMETALKAIEAGEPMTETLRAKYFSAAMNKRDRETRGEESAAAAAATGGAAAPVATTPDLGDQVVAAMEKQGLLAPPKKSQQGAEVAR